jgi:hypothetical protein
VEMRREKTGPECKERKEGERERKRKERGEILNIDGRKIRWMKEKWKRKKRTEKEKHFFFNCSFTFKEKCNQESEIIVICTTSYESHTFFHEFAD